MLLELHVRNFALIEQADLVFREGLTVLSGETGAGKSILIDSISAALGAKAGKDLIRTGAEYAYIELLFSVEGEERRQEILDLGITPEEDGTLILSRKIMKNRSVMRVNDEAVTAALLKKLTGMLIDIHGQHEHQKLLYPESHLTFIDRMAPEELSRLKERTAGCYKRYAEIRAVLKKEADRSFRAREEEILRYEVAEIEAARLRPGEEEELRAEYTKVRNAARITAALSEAAEALETDQVSRAVRRISDVTEYAPELETLRAELEELDALLSDARRNTGDLIREMTFDEQRLAELAERLDLIRGLEDKYGEDVPGILELLGRKQERLAFLETFEARRADMAAEAGRLEKELSALSDRITSIRKETAARLAGEISGQLKALNFAGSVFEIRFTEKEGFGPDGRDGAEFFISTNPGEPPKPLKNVASGGELSRIMLAMKTVLADRDETETLIFDEIDTGISGRTAQMVSERLAMAARKRQVLCITHLPQIAAMADHHLLIRKETDGSRTRTGIREISGEEITGELARLIGGTTITSGVLQTAGEMKTLAEEKKSQI